MSDHADTIRHALEALDRDSQFLDGREYSPAELAENLGALDALVAENSRLNVSEADWCSQALEAQAENQRLRDALERIKHVPYRLPYSVIGDAESDLQAVKEIARAALDGPK